MMVTMCVYDIIKNSFEKGRLVWLSFYGSLYTVATYPYAVNTDYPVVLHTHISIIEPFSFVGPHHL